MSQTITVSASTPLRYPFLSSPPQKKRPTAPPPPLPLDGPHPRRTLGLGPPPRRSPAIAAWAAAVQPGSPRSVRVASASFVITPTSATSGLGSPTFAVAIPPSPCPASAAKPAPTPTEKPARRLASLSALRIGRRAPSSSSGLSPVTPPPVPSSKPKGTKKAPAPLALHHDALLLQMLDGGSLDASAARALAGSGTAAYKDAAGAVWRDEAEAAEFAALLAGAGSPGWVAFPSPGTGSPPSTASLRAGMPPLTPLSATLLAMNAPLAPPAPASPGFSLRQLPRAVLALPARPRRGGPAAHLRSPSYLTAPTAPAPACAPNNRRTRRRPAPLALPAAPAPASPRTNRALFLADSFVAAPPPSAAPVPMVPTTPAVLPAGFGHPASHPLVPADKRRRGVLGLFRKSGKTA